MQCELCGGARKTLNAVVEGVEMSVCRECAGFGKVLEQSRRISAPQQAQRMHLVPELQQSESVVADIAQQVRAARERKGLTQEQFARLLSEKESIVHKIESGAFIPPISTARKLEKILKMRLVETVAEVPVANAGEMAKSSVLTIGDMVKKR